MASSDLAIHVNSQETFFLNEKIVCLYFGKLRKIIKQEKRRNQIKISAIEMEDFPGGPAGFERIAGFCYNGGKINLSAANVSLFHCSAVFLGMTTEGGGNLLRQTEEFLAGILDWPLADVVVCLKTCDGFFHYADSLGLVGKLVSGMLVKISDRDRVSSEDSRSSSDSSKAEWWWFDELVGLSPMVIEMMVKKLGAFRSENNSLTLTRFLLHYLKKRVPRAKSIGASNSGSVQLPEFSLADTAIHGVISSGRNTFSCRGLLCVLRVVSAFNPAEGFKGQLERMIGELLDQASLDDLLVCGGGAGVYDVDLVIRLVRIFVLSIKEVTESSHGSSRKMKRVVRLLDKYLREISPDHTLEMSKFLEVAESLPKSARDCFDGVYRAMDIYLESHPTLSFEERSRICRCLDFSRLSMEACKEIAKNPKIPPNVAVQALMSKRSSSSNHNNHHLSADQPSTTHPRKSKSGRSSSTPSRALTKKDNADSDIQLRKYSCSTPTRKSRSGPTNTPNRVLTKKDNTDFDTQLRRYSCSTPTRKSKSGPTNTPNRVSMKKDNTNSDTHLQKYSCSTPAAKGRVSLVWKQGGEEDEDEVEKRMVRMQKRVVELERACQDMKNQMSRMENHGGGDEDGSSSNNGLKIMAMSFGFGKNMGRICY